jgi:hypothetical protein
LELISLSNDGRFVPLDLLIAAKRAAGKDLVVPVSTPYL